MITLLECLGLLVVGLFVSKILTGLIDAHSEKKRKEAEEYQKLLDIKRKAEYEELLKDSERIERERMQDNNSD